MKTLKNIILTLLSIIMLSSCDDFLNREPSNYGDAETAVKTAADVDVMINGLNRNLTSMSYYGRNMFLYGDAKGGDLTIVSQGRGYDGLFTFNHAANSGNYSGFWTVGYDCIMQVNTLLQNIAKLKNEGSTENFDSQLAQLMTTRALVYYDLVRLYGKPYDMDKTSYGVPNVIKVLSASDKPGRDKVEDNYTQIVKDLTEAAPLFNKNVHKNGYVNYYANRAILARVYMDMKKYPEALALAEEIMASPKFDLYTNGEWVDSWKKQFGKESIFELGIFDNEADAGNSSLGACYSRGKDLSSRVLGYFVASSYFLERLGEDPGDIRWGIMSYDEKSKTRMGACYKYLGSVAKEGDGKASKTAVNVKVIRLSEIYLIAAEAALMQPAPDKTKAKNYLNRIRKRSPGLLPATETTVSLEMIFNEKSKEFYGEGQRFFDLIRTNQTITFDDETPDVATSLRPNKIDRTFEKCILPISQSECNANSTIASQQNPGY